MKNTLYVVGLSILVASSADAATITLGTNTVASTAAESFEVSVFDTKASYKTSDDATVAFGDGTVTDYAFYNSTGTAGYANGAAGVIGTPSISSISAGSNDWAQVWESDPGADFSTTADFTTDTLARVASVDGTLDLSGYSSGTVYFLFGSFDDDDTASVSLTLSGSGQTSLLASTGTLNTVNNGHIAWVSDFSFTTDSGLYDTLDYSYLNSDSDGSRARFMGVVIDATGIPEPGTYTLLAGLTGLAFAMVRRRRV